LVLSLAFLSRALAGRLEGTAARNVRLIGLKEHMLSRLAIHDQASHVSLHLLDFGKQSNEITVDGLKEVSKRALNLLHLKFDADDALMELLADVGRARIVLVLGNQHLVGLHVRNFLLPQLDVIVG